MKRQIHFILTVIILVITGCKRDTEIPCKIIPGQVHADAIAGGFGFSRICNKGFVYATGWNNYGQLGNGNQTNSNVLVQVKGDITQYK